MTGPGVDRRSFIKIGATVAGGLMVGVPLGCTPGREPVVASELNAFVEVSSDGMVTIFAPVPEIGQGVRTALPMLVAEELDAPWDRVTVRQAPGDDRYGPRQIAAGSVSVSVYWEPLRRAGAAARAVLVEAAAARWGVEAASCTTAAGRVVHPGGRLSFGYGELAAEAALRPVPEEFSLKSPEEFTLVGRPVRNVDAEAIVRGEPLFGLDVERPGMLRAVVARCPSYGGRIIRYDDTAALAVPGVVRTVRIEAIGSEERPFVDEGVAVVAETTWAALQGREALTVEWDLGPNAAESTADLHERCRAFVDRPGDVVVRDDGYVDAALAAGSTRLDATYHLPFIAHVCMEPMNCTAEVTPEKCEIWTPTQTPGNVRNAFANRLEMPVESVTVHSMRCGGGFGRRVGPEDFEFEAVQISAAVGRPVQVVWSREDDIRHDAYRPFSYHRLAAALDDRGNPTALRHRQAGTSRHAFRPAGTPERSEFFVANFPGGLLDNYRLEYTLAESNLPRTILRAPGNNALSFVVESFIDEMAAAGGRDPLEYRLDLLGEDREFPFDEDYPVISTARMKNVLRTAAAGAGWGQALPPGRGHGIASHFTFGTYVAYVVDVTVDPSTGAFAVDRVVGAIDCGRPVNPLGIRAQVEGGVHDGLHAARHGEITFAEGAVEQSNFHDYPLARMTESAKRIDVHIVDSRLPPTGVGEPPYPPMLPALGNALYAATGVRVRRLPIRLDELRRTPPVG